MSPVRPAEVFALVADVGGTNTRVALADGPGIVEGSIRRYRNADFARLEDVLAAYRAEQGNIACRAASVAIAGPVRDGRGRLTNLDWTIDEAALAAVTGAGTAAVLNDLQAQGHALGRIAPGTLRTVVEGMPAPPGAPQLVIGVGTGFNTAPVHHVGAHRLVAAAEAGHETLPASTEEEFRLSRYIAETHGFPAVEEVLSGRGLVRIYAWLAAEAGANAEADAARIMEACRAGSDALAEAAVSHFVRFLGSVAGNQALNHLPFGGIFLAGGVARAMAPHFDRFGFAEALRDKGRFSEFLAAFPVHVIEDDYAALTGSAAHLAQAVAGKGSDAASA